MNTLTDNTAKKLLLLVLVPHRDLRLAARNWSAALFAQGFEGAWSFPHVVPLALLSRPFAKEERRALARTLRSLVSLNEGGKCSGGETELLPLCGEQWAVFGPVLNIGSAEGGLEAAIADNPGREKVLRSFPRPVLGCGLSCGEEPPPAPPFSFRAAAVANMRYRQTAAGALLSHSWEIGELSWLPRGDHG